MDLNGHIILPAAYDDITNLDEPLLTARTSSREQPVTSLHLPTGETFFQSSFDHVNWCQDGKHFYCCRPGLCEMYEYEPLA